MAKIKKIDDIFCPSYQAVENAIIIGKFNKKEQVNFFKRPKRLKQNHIDELSKKGLVEDKLRLAGICMNKQCHQWDGRGCSLPEKVLNTETIGKNKSYKNCTIQANCRWYQQKGKSICKSCSMVMRNKELANAYMTKNINLNMSI